MSKIYWIDDPRLPELVYTPEGVCCPNMVGYPDHLHIQTYGNQNLTVRACTEEIDPTYPDCKCSHPSGHIGWGGHVGESDFWCSNEVGISEVITIEVPEPSSPLMLALGVALLMTLARIWRRRA